MNKIIAIVVLCMVGCASLSDSEKRRYREERRRDKQAYKLDVIKAKNTKFNHNYNTINETRNNTQTYNININTNNGVDNAPVKMIKRKSAEPTDAGTP
jgi:Tfp pilus assembly protein PilP